MKSLKGLLTGAVLLAAAALPMTALAAGEIVVAIGSEPSTLDPQARDDGGERAVNDNIYETLMARDADGTLVPGLAAGPPTKIDDTTWEFKLRPNIKFTNGEPFNADSVVTSVDAHYRSGAQVRADGLFRHHQGRREGRRPHRPDHHHRAGSDPAVAHVLDEDDPAEIRRRTRSSPRRRSAPARTSSRRSIAARTSSSSPIPTTGAARRRSTR